VTLDELIAEYFQHLDRAESLRAEGRFVEYGQALEAAEEVRLKIEALLTGG
jgi:hypothetical protein